MTVDLFNKNEVKAEWLHPTEFPSMKGRQVVAIRLIPQQRLSQRAASIVLDQRPAGAPISVCTVPCP